MKTYIFHVKHDGGTLVHFQIRAASLEAGKRIVMDLEKCPERAIVSWSIKPTKRQVQKTINLLRNL